MTEFNPNYRGLYAAGHVLARAPSPSSRAHRDWYGAAIEWLRRRQERRRTRRTLIVAGAMALLFALDIATEQRIGITILYAALIFVLSRTEQNRTLCGVASISTLLAVITFAIGSGSEPTAISTGRLTLGLAGIWAATLYRLRDRRSASSLPHWASVLDQTHDSIAVRDLSGRLTYWNGSAANRYGWSADEAYGRLADELLQTRYPVPRREIMDQVLAGGRWEGELRNLTKAGRELCIDSRWSVIRDDRGGAVGILETGSDVTRRNAADLELSRSEARRSHIFQTIGVPLYECDLSAIQSRCDRLRQSGITDFRQYFEDNDDFVREAIRLSRAIDVNDASVRLFQAASRQALIDGFAQIWPETSARVYAAALVAWTEHRPTFESEVSLQTIDGCRLDLLLTVSFPPETDARKSIILAFVDVTASNQAKNDLQIAQADLAHAMRLTSLGELTATIAHEVNQPLGGIVANGRAALRWLQRDVPELSEVRNSIEQSVAEGLRAAEVIHKIREIAHKGEPHMVAIEVNVLLKETIELLKREINRAGIDLRLDLGALMQPMLADRIEVQQVMINIILNSVHALGTIVDRRRELRVSTREAEGALFVRLDDNGPGIEAELQSKLFTPFFTTKDEGMGLGLSVCSSIVRRCSGSIGIMPKQGPGLAIEIRFPVYERGGAS